MHAVQDLSPTSTRCHSAWQPKPGRGFTYRRGDFVQTSGTSSDFWLHLIGSVAANFLDNVNGLPAVASSPMLAHIIPKDSKDEAAPTTREFYLTSQRINLKTDAMSAWTEALMNSYAKRGGEKGRVRKMKFGCQYASKSDPSLRPMAASRQR